MRLRQPSLLGGGTQPAEVTAGRRAERRVHGGGRRALELAHLGRHLVRGDHERVRQGVPAKFAWSAAFGLVVTLVWLYLELLRLLAILRN